MPQAASAAYQESGGSLATAEVSYRLEADGLYPAGRREVMWGGVDLEGRALSSGVYFVRLTAGNESRTEKIVLAR